jgi:hypothetical protein
MGAMSEANLFRRISAALEQAGIPYMLTGSFASTYYGKARATQDIDLVISATPEQIRTFVSLLPANEYYSDLNSALDALKHQSMFNILDMESCLKIDLIICKSGAYSQQAFRRRISQEIGGVRMFVATAEDLVLSKLDWAKLGQSSRQIDDVEGVLRVQWDSLDKDYLKHWVSELRLESQWQAALHQAGIQSV